MSIACCSLRERIADADKRTAAIHDAARDSAESATEARREAERLKEKRTATAEELDGLWKQLQTVEARNLFLESSSSKLATDLSSLRANAAALESIAAEKDREAAALRDQNGFLGESAKHRADALEEAHKQLTAARTRADRLAGEIRLYRLVLGIAALLYVLWLVIRFLLPRRLIP